MCVQVSSGVFCWRLYYRLTSQISNHVMYRKNIEDNNFHSKNKKTKVFPFNVSLYKQTYYHVNSTLFSSVQVCWTTLRVHVTVNTLWLCSVCILHITQLVGCHIWSVSSLHTSNSLYESNSTT